jgi:UDP-2-acetamido-3-amino-2,3-dideoxy-glucuronate N-acetyltransferase
MSELRSSQRAPGLLLGEDVELPDDLELGGNVVIHTGTRIGRNCAIGDLAVVGRPPTLAATSTAPRGAGEPTLLDDGARVLAGAVVAAGAQLSAGSIVGDQAQVRERATVGTQSVIGRGSAVDNDVEVGARVKVQTNCYLTAYSLVENDVFVGPGVVLTNDDTMARHPKGEGLVGPTLRRACRIGGGAVIRAGIEIGEEAFVGAGAVVIADVEPRSVVIGVPARKVREVEDADLLERWR